MKEPVRIAERMVGVTNCEKRLRAIAVKHKGKKSYWYSNNLPSRKINAVKCTIYFNFVAYNLIAIFKKTLLEK